MEHLPQLHTSHTLNAEELTHLHLVCGKCEAVGDAPLDVAASFVNALSDEYGFKTDVSHFAIYGTCSNCQ